MNDFISKEFNEREYLSTMYPGFGDTEYEAFKKALPNEKLKSFSPLFFGSDISDDEEVIDGVVGGICIRQEIKIGISLNELYQGYMALLAASHLGIQSCTLMIPDGEEISLAPNNKDAISEHCNILESALRSIAKELSVTVHFIRTSDPSFQSKIRNVFDDYYIHVSPEESIFISRMNHKNDSTEKHSQERTKVTEWFMQYHTRAFTEEVLGYTHALIVEDLGQHRLYSAASKALPRLGMIAFAAFLPLSDITGTKSAFSAEVENKILFPMDTSFFVETLTKKASAFSLFMLCELERLIGKNTAPNFSSETVSRTLNYFNQSVAGGLPTHEPLS